MAIQDDYSKDLADELLTDMADHFFGARKHLEETIDVFQEYVADLRQKQVILEQRFRFFNYLLISPETAEKFYRSIGVKEIDAIPTDRKLSEKVIPVHAPSGFTVKGQYLNLTAWAYDALEKECKAYLFGKSFQEMGKEGYEQKHASYELVMGMHQLINQEIRRVNASVSPSHVLQTAKRFDSEAQMKERLTGGGSYYGDDSIVNRRLAFAPIEEASLNIRKFPKLPEKDRIAHRIAAICKHAYADHSESIRQIVQEVKDKIREAYG